jgi:hypothetical protein
METQRQALNTAIYSGLNPGTSAYDAINDLANDPILATQMAPNQYQTTTGAFYNAASGGTNTFNATYSPDGTHPLFAANTAADPVGVLALFEMEGKLKQPFWLPKTIPAAVIGTFAGASQAIPLVKLQPGWMVCGVKAQVTAAFAGTGITALTSSLGDSSDGSTPATTYTSPLTLLSTGNQYSLPTFISSNGVVQATVTATGGNLSALASSTGSISYSVCIVHP